MKTAGNFSKAEKQLLKDHESLRVFAAEKLNGKLKRDVKKEFFTYGKGFIVMPNCNCQVDSAVKPCNGIFMKDCEDVETFSRWWDKNITCARANTCIKQDLFELLVMR